MTSTKMMQPKPTYLVGIRDESDAPTLAEALRRAARSGGVVHAAHVITSAEEKRVDEADRLARVDRAMEDARKWIRAMAFQLDPRQSIPTHIEVFVNPNPHVALIEAARRYGATLMMVGEPNPAHVSNAPHLQTVAQLIRQAPCSVMTVRPMLTGQGDNNMLEPAPAPGEHIRKQNAVSHTHVYMPTGRRDRRRGHTDITGPFDWN